MSATVTAQTAERIFADALTHDDLDSADELAGALLGLTRAWVAVCLTMDDLTGAYGQAASELRRRLAHEIAQIGASGAPAIAAEALGYITTSLTGTLLTDTGISREIKVTGLKSVTAKDIAKAIGVERCAPVTITEGRLLFYDSSSGAAINTNATALTVTSGVRRVVRGPAFYTSHPVYLKRSPK